MTATRTTDQAVTVTEPETAGPAPTRKTRRLAVPAAISILILAWTTTGISSKVTGYQLLLTIYWLTALTVGTLGVLYLVAQRNSTSDRK